MAVSAEDEDDEEVDLATLDIEGNGDRSEHWKCFKCVNNSYGNCVSHVNFRCG